MPVKYLEDKTETIIDVYPNVTQYYYNYDYNYDCNGSSCDISHEIVCKVIGTSGYVKLYEKDVYIIDITTGEFEVEEFELYLDLFLNKYYLANDPTKHQYWPGPDSWD